MDWDGDGDMDLLIGDRNGYITYYENTGTARIPSLTNRGHIKDGSQDLNVVNNAVPCIFDWNLDGKKDLVVGCENYKVLLYLNVGSNNAPLFNGYSTIVENYTWSENGIMRNHPQVADLNKDGKFDLIVGEEWGTIHYFKNTGSNSSPRFGASEHLMLTSGEKAKVSSRAHISVVDWDGDGNLDIISGSGNGNSGLTFFKNAASPVSIDSHDEIPVNYSLEQNYPNPFNPETRISFLIPKQNHVKINVFNSLGQLVTTLVDNELSAGKHEVMFNGINYPSGVYFYQLVSEGFVETRKLILLK